MMRIALFVAGTLLIVGMAGQFIERFGIAPRLLGTYIERHTAQREWLVALGRSANQALQALDRGDPPPQRSLPEWVGARVAAAASGPSPLRPVAAPEQLRAALRAAQAGDVIVIAPGVYRFSGAPLQTLRGGTEKAPITVRAETFGAVTLEVDMAKGFEVTAPHWRFENLVVRGMCASSADCEHAFHVEGGAHGVVIQNNLMREFNAPIKINGHEGLFPDRGQVVGNTLVNASPRKTQASVIAIDLEAARDWSIEGNLIADFVKADGDLTSYGASARGAASGTRFLRNVVLCEQRLRGAAGARVGLSFGGGGSSPERCRERKCSVEHDDGLMAANLIAACSDEGIYVKRSPRSHLEHNTLLDTAGIYLRYPETSATVTANVVDGPIRAREGASLQEDANTGTALWALYLGRHPVRRMFADAGALDLGFQAAPPKVPAPRYGLDLCGAQRPPLASAGAFEDFAACLRAGAR